MKKRGLLVLLVLTLLCALTACGGAKEDDGIDEAQIEASAQNLMQTLEATPDQEIQSMLAYYETSADTDETAALNVALLTDFMEVRPELGAFEGFGEFTLEKSGKTYTATQRVDYSDRDIDLVYVISAINMDVTVININPVYSLGEIMGKAGLNTVMGIGIVFIVLLLMFGLISCFRIIPVIEKKLTAPKEAPEVPFAKELSEDAPDTDIPSSDDGTLVAVIAAAIAAATGTTTDDFVVRSIRRRYTR